MIPSFRVLTACVVISAFSWLASQAPAQPALPAPTASDYLLELTQFATHSGSHAIDVAAPHDGSGNVYVSAQSGEIFAFDNAGNSLGTFLDMASTTATTGFQSGSFTPGSNGAAFRGLMYFDFHPDFGTPGAAGEGKVYTGFQSTPGIGTIDYQVGSGNQYVISEWEVSSSNPNQIDTSSYREVMRLGFNGGNPHAIGEIAFNPLSQPGDDDYGMLYAAIGDAGATGNVPPPTGYIQEIDNPFGKIIRINPLQDGSNSYSIPDNPFSSVAGAATENYALGFRDPQTFSFAKDSNDETVLITFDIGAEEREEVNLVRPGSNHGWVRWEGTYELAPTRPIYDEANTTLASPVLEYDHATGGFAIAGGLLVSDPNNVNFRNQVLFGDLVRGKIFHGDYADMLVAEANGTQATVFESQVEFDGNTGTFSEVRGGEPGTRGDARFGTDEAGNVYIVSKRSDVVYATGLKVASQVASNLTLTVNRESGEVFITNGNTATAIGIDAYELGSANGLLNQNGWISLADIPTAGWEEAPNASANGLAEFNSTANASFDLAPGSSQSLGFAYTGDVSAAMAAVGFGNDYEDVTFGYSDAAANQFANANTVYVGERRHNNLVIEVDINTGEAQLINESPLSVAIDLYQVTSDEGVLDTGIDGLTQNGSAVAGWETGGMNSSNGFAQFFPTGTNGFAIAGGEVFDLGSAFVAGSESRDLEFLFHIVGDELGFEGVVRYIESVALPGDFNDDGVIDAGDYVYWRDNLGAPESVLPAGSSDGNGTVDVGDYVLWKTNFETSNLGASVVTTQVPEPRVVQLLCGALAIAALFQKHFCDSFSSRIGS